MSVFDPIKAALETVSGLTGKVYHAEALKNASAPFVFWLQTGESFEQALDGYTELGENLYEIHLVAKRLDTLDPAASAARAAVIALQGTTADGVLFERIDIRQISPLIHEKEVGLYRKVYQLDVNYQLV